MEIEGTEYNYDEMSLRQKGETELWQTDRNYKKPLNRKMYSFTYKKSGTLGTTVT